MRTGLVSDAGIESLEGVLAIRYRAKRSPEVATVTQPGNSDWRVVGSQVEMTVKPAASNLPKSEGLFVARPASWRSAEAAIMQSANDPRRRPD